MLKFVLNINSHSSLHLLSGLPVFTAPFIVSTWCEILLIQAIDINTVSVSFVEKNQ